MSRLPCQALLLALLVIGLAGPVGAEEEDPLARVTTEALARELPKADANRRARLMAALRKRGSAAARVLRALSPRADDATKRIYARLIARIVEDWERSQTPEGMIYVPGGFVITPRGAAPFGPARRRTFVSSFYMDRTEVTVGAWREWVAKQDAAREDSALLGGGVRAFRPPEAWGDDYPMVRVSHEEAERYAKEMRGGELPTRLQYCRAVRRNGSHPFPWGRGSAEGRANCIDTGPGEALPVGSHSRGVSPDGIHDLFGNVAEWLRDRLPGGTARRSYRPMAIGGSWWHRSDPELAWGMGSQWGPRASRDRRNWLGFRVVASPPPLPGSPEAQAGR